MMNPSPHSSFHSAFPVPPIDDLFSLQLQDFHTWPISLEFNIPNSKFDASPVLNAEFSPTYPSEEPSEDAARSNRESGSGSESPSKEARPGRRKRGRSGQGAEATKKSKHAAYKGVRKRESKWVSEIREPGKKSRIWLGTFSTPEMAARAYDVAAFNLKTPYAYLNFPEHVSSLPVLLSRSAKEIQAAASMAAAAFRGGASNSKIGGVVPTSQADQSSTLSFTSMPVQQQKHLLPQSTSPPTTAPPFLDEDMIFDMPNVLADMAEGLAITPPLLYHGTDADNNYNGGHGHNGAESSLWNM